MSDLYRLIWCALIGLFRPRAALEAEILVLRHQLNVLRRKSPKRVAFGNSDRLVFAGLSLPEIKSGRLRVQSAQHRQAENAANSYFGGHGKPFQRVQAGVRNRAQNAILPGSRSGTRRRRVPLATRLVGESPDETETAIWVSLTRVHRQGDRHD